MSITAATRDHDTASVAVNGSHYVDRNATAWRCTVAAAFNVLRLFAAYGKRATVSKKAAIRSVKGNR